MSAIFKTILGVFLAVIILYCGLGIVGANNDAAAAEEYVQHLANEISSHDYSHEIISECVTQAEENGYLLDVKLVTDSDGKTLYAVCTLHFTYDITMFGGSEEHTKQVIAY